MPSDTHLPLSLHSSLTLNSQPGCLPSLQEQSPTQNSGKPDATLRECASTATGHSQLQLSFQSTWREVLDSWSTLTCQRATRSAASFLGQEAAGPLTANLLQRRSQLRKKGPHRSWTAMPILSSGCTDPGSPSQAGSKRTLPAPWTGA